MFLVVDPIYHFYIKFTFFMEKIQYSWAFMSLAPINYLAFYYPFIRVIVLISMKSSHVFTF